MWLLKRSDLVLEDYKEVVNDENSAALLWALLCSYLPSGTFLLCFLQLAFLSFISLCPSDEQSIQRLFVHRAEFDLALTYQQIKDGPGEQFYATALRFVPRCRLCFRLPLLRSSLPACAIA